MTPSFGPWATAIHVGREPQLSTFWKRRLAMLSAMSGTAPGLHRRAAVFLAAVALVALAWPTWQLGSQADDAPAAPADERDASADAEPPMSIFNDQLRQFKFRLDHTVVTPEVAHAFMQHYSHARNPEIIGAYADRESDSLVVIGPPRGGAGDPQGPGDLDHRDPGDRQSATPGNPTENS